jgi:CheY-like chemotaxis protein
MTSQKEILIVEDNPMNMELASFLLELAGFKISQASNALDGIKTAKQNNPALILMDIGLPGMDGLQAMAVLRQDPATRDIPVIAFSASAMESDVQRALSAGCLGYVIKPIDTRTFTSTITSLLAKHENRATQGTDL